LAGFLGNSCEQLLGGDAADRRHATERRGLALLGVVLAEEADHGPVLVGQLDPDHRRARPELLVPLVVLGQEALVVDVDCSTAMRCQCISNLFSESVSGLRTGVLSSAGSERSPLAGHGHARGQGHRPARQEDVPVEPAEGELAPVVHHAVSLSRLKGPDPRDRVLAGSGSVS
jgi:hypothetical protein